MELLAPDAVLRAIEARTRQPASDRTERRIRQGVDVVNGREIRRRLEEYYDTSVWPLPALGIWDGGLEWDAGTTWDDRFVS